MKDITKKIDKESIWFIYKGYPIVYMGIPLWVSAYFKIFEHPHVGLQWRNRVNTIMGMYDIPLKVHRKKGRMILTYKGRSSEFYGTVIFGMPLDSKKIVLEEISKA